MDTQAQKQLFAELEGLLKDQVELARQDRPAELEVLAEQAQGIVDKLKQAGAFEPARFEAERQRLRGLYDRLRLTLGSQMDQIGQELSRVRKGRKTIGAYRQDLG